MPASRRCAGTPRMDSPSSSTSPESGVSKPASIRSAVVLPQPEGPSRASSSPGWTVRSRPSSAVVAPKLRRSCRNSTVALVAVAGAAVVATVGAAFDMGVAP